MSNTNASVLAVPPEHLVAVKPEACTPEMLVAAANRLLVRAVAALATRTPGKPVLLYGADASLASELAVELNLQDCRAYFASSDPHVPDSWIKVHAQSSKRVMQRAVPRDVALFIDCTAVSSPSSAVANALRDCLAPGCKYWQLDARLLEEPFRLPGAEKAKMAALLEDAYAYTQKTEVLAQSSLDCNVVEAAALSGAQVSSLARKRYVTDWQKRESLLLTVPPFDTRGLFRPDRTYLMVGAAGGLGLSICKWILANGAKHMAITSRNPKVDPAFLEDTQRAGASVHVLPMDVGNKVSVDSVVAHVRATMPPIAGVCNAAMVLSDRLFLDMDVGQLNGTLAPKVDGSEHLDAAFANETQLDFFIMLSSSASVLGNVGQANYHMANLFMTSLAASRRARGLAGSVVHVGHITDVGYVATGDRTEQLEEHFRTLRLMPLSETDVHHAFAQAIRGGRPGSQVASPDIIMGVEPPTKPVAADVAGQTKSKIPWLANPRLGHLVPIITLDGESGRQGQNGAGAAGSVLQRVQDADSEEEAVASVLEAFCAKLESTLQLPEGYAVENASRAAIDLGIDSLVAVEIRTWFLKELGAEVPVVKVLGGDSVLQICTAAAGAVMARSMKMQGEAEPKAKANGESNGSVKASPIVSPPIVSPPIVSPPIVSPPIVSPPIVSVNATQAPAPTLERPLELDNNNTSVSGTNNGSTGSSSPSQDAHSSETSASVLKLDDSASASEAEEAEGKGKTGGHEVTATRPKVIRQERMSRAQARIWFLSKHLDDPAAYNMVFLYRIHGPLNMTRLRHALQVTTHHHECLRMCFYPRVGDGHGMQGLMASSAYELEHVPDADEADLHSTMARFKARAWDLEAGKTMGIAVLSRGPEAHDFVLGYHHVISDVVGTHIFLQDLDRAYRTHRTSTTRRSCWKGRPLECMTSRLNFGAQNLPLCLTLCHCYRRPPYTHALLPSKPARRRRTFTASTTHSRPQQWPPSKLHAAGCASAPSTSTWRCCRSYWHGPRAPRTCASAS
jgi:NAD(P)-dependent dehydrogenase (short-subunit alcohol dehydrogenase family)